MAMARTKASYTAFGTRRRNKEKGHMEQYIPCYECDGGPSGRGCKVCGGAGGRWVKWEIMG